MEPRVGFPPSSYLALIHPSAWKMRSRKSISRNLHNSANVGVKKGLLPRPVADSQPQGIEQ
jgi:hypothetical protein